MKEEVFSQVESSRTLDSLHCLSKYIKSRARGTADCVAVVKR